MTTNVLPSPVTTNSEGAPRAANRSRWGKLPLTGLTALLLSGAMFANAPLVRAETAGTDLAATPTAAAPAAEAPKAKSVGAGLGLSPNAPQLGGGSNITVKEGESLTPTVSAGTADEWKFDFHGYLRGPMRMSFGPPTPNAQAVGQTPSPVPSGTQMHGWPRVPGASYIQWEYTNTIPGPWSQLNFSYGNSRASMTVIVDAYGQTSAGYRNLQSQQGVDQAFITLNFPEALGNAGGLVLNVGSFQNRYGTAGKYDAGMYETYMFGRTHVAGETLTANIDTGSEWGVTVEHGIGSKIEIIPFTNNQLYQLAKSTPVGGTMRWNDPPHRSDRELEYLPYAGPTPQGSTFLTHLHVGLAYKKLLTFGAHVLYSWTPDDNWDATNSNVNNVTNATQRANGPTKGSMMVTGGEVRLNGGYLGDGYFGYSHIDAKNINALADALEVLHSNGGWQFKQNFFGQNYNFHTGEYLGPQNETGKVDTLQLQYTFSFGGWARRPAGFWGDGPDLAVTVFGLMSMVNSPALNSHSMTTKKLKFGTDVIYTPLSWFGIGGRFDMVQPDMDAIDGGSTRNFTVLSPRLVFKTNFVTHEAVTIVYQHYILGSATYPVYPYEWVGKADSDVLAVSGTMWW